MQKVKFFNYINNNKIKYLECIMNIQITLYEVMFLIKKDKQLLNDIKML